MENAEIPVGKSNNTHHSIWSTSEIMGFWSKWCIFITPFGIYSWCSYILHVIHLLLRQPKSFQTNLTVLIEQYWCWILNNYSSSARWIWDDRYIANEARSAELPIIISYPTSARWIIVLLKTIRKYFLDLADFALQEQPEDNLMVAVSRAWYNC